MNYLRVCTLLVIIVCTQATPTSRPAFWKGTSFDATVEEMRSLCAEDDPIACLKFKAISFLNSFFQKDSFAIGDDVEVTRNSAETGRSVTVEDTVEQFFKSHDVTFKLPTDSTVTIGGRNLDQDVLDLKFNFGSGRGVEARKSKLKKILIPILVFVLLKAITLVPLALGVLGLKAWNALQLSFFSFIVAVGLAVFQLCKKIASDHAHPQIAAHAPWEPAHLRRSYEMGVNEKAQEMAYSAYAPKN